MEACGAAKLSRRARDVALGISTSSSPSGCLKYKERVESSTRSQRKSNFMLVHFIQASLQGFGGGIGLAAGQLARHGKPVAHAALGKYILGSGGVFSQLAPNMLNNHLQVGLL